MRWIGAFVLGNVLWFIITFVAGILFSFTGLEYLSSWSDFLNFAFYPLGLWLGFKITKTPFLGSKPTSQKPEPENDKEEMVREFYELLEVYTRSTDADQIKIALSLQVLWKMLIAEFEVPENFGSANKDRQMGFLSKIGDIHAKSTIDEMRHMEIATGLFGKSLAPVIAGDMGLAEELTKEIEPINRLGWEQRS